MSGGYFFNGRQYVTPAVMSAVNDSAMANPNENIGNKLVLIGSASDGVPNTELQFQSFAQAQAALVSGDLVDACRAAFDPSADTVGPAVISCIRVDPAVQATRSLVDGSASAVIDLTSVSYGPRGNQVKVSVAAGSVQGLKLTTAFGTSVYTQDNVYNAPFSIQYTGGSASANMSIADTTVTIQSPTNTTVASIDLTQFTNVQQLVDRINSITGFSATVLGGNGASPTLHGLDFVTTQDVKTALYTATANLQAAVNWFNGAAEGLVSAVRHAGAGTLPAVVSNAYLSGGSVGTVTNTQWSNAFTLMQGIDCSWMCPLSSGAAIQDMADAHAAYMSGPGQQERRNFVGMALGTSDAAAITAAGLVNSDRTSLVHLGYYDYDVNTGAYTLYQPYILAAMIAGAFSGISPGTPMTNKTLKVRGMERQLLNPSNTDALITGGVLCVYGTPTGFKVVQSITTWIQNNNFNRVEVSTGAAMDFTLRTVRAALDPIKGARAAPATLGLAVSLAETALKGLSVPDPNGPGCLVGDANSPPYKNIVATLVGDVIGVMFQASPVIPANFIPVTVYAVPYSGTASAQSNAGV